MSLHAQKVTVSATGTPLLVDVNVAVTPGQVTTVLGPNGAGKTSLVRVLSGELKPQTGAVTLGDKPLSEWPAQQLARSLAVLPQHSLLNFPFTAAEVVMLGRTPHDTGLARDTEIVYEALASVDGDYLASRVYTQLSGGEKQRVHLARVLAQIWEPLPGVERFLVLDEPTASFDLAHQQMTLEVVSSLAKRGVGVLIVLHDLNLAARCADQMVLMQCASVAHSGTPDEVLNAETIESVFQIQVQMGEHPVTGSPLVIP
ncbi:MAG: heme ABC transporter ATP-binding protein [Halioglobus sp.]